MLTGWAAAREEATPGGGQQGLRYTFPPLAAERDEAARVKQARPILVMLGNPPYNAFAGTSPAEESGLVEPYKAGLQRDWGIRKFVLDDLYVRFFWIAERRIAEGTGRGVVCFISSDSWLAGSSFVIMRQQLLREFDQLWIDDLHGDRKASERGPDGRTSQTVFAMQGFSPGIKPGTAISLLVRKAVRSSAPNVYFNTSNDASSAERRREQLLESLTVKPAGAAYTRVNPLSISRY